MVSSFWTKTIQVDVDTGSWVRPATVPAFLRNSSGARSIDLGQALHMLGTLTMPNLSSPASPALFWAWLRYYLAPAMSTDFRITMDFADLDPHQKGILSDDFGVAISTKWLVDRLGGFRDIVDGRRFALQFPRLLRKKHKSKAKVGPSKAPDFVIRDLAGRWHVLECKGTQASRDYQRRSLKIAIPQKRAIQIVGSRKGEQLAAALYIANSEDQGSSYLKVIDPNDPPLLRLDETQADEMDAKVHRLAVARAMGIIGLNELASELSIPSDVDPESELLRPSEASRIRSPRTARSARASEQARERTLGHFTRATRRYDGREVFLELPLTATRLPFRSVMIRQGVNSDLIDELSGAESLMDDSVDHRLKPFAQNAQIILESDANHMTISYGDILFSEIIWT